MKIPTAGNVTVAVGRIATLSSNTTLRIESNGSQIVPSRSVTDLSGATSS